ncbi:hypothetical protein PybrP1_005402 [[Pythium] brassicae (nom. inval.)]|nr:hypothetical protein PybrP1_005402 [[Pythium] brassicae (nom. inval.)]
MSDDALLAENEKELAGFASGANTTITPVLERVLEEVRITGVPRYAWPQLRALLVAQLQRAMDQVAATDATAATAFVGWSPTNKNRANERRNNITELLTSFEGPPFTLQRLTEVLVEPKKSYKTLNKLINALEKLLAVSTTIQVVDPRAPVEADAAEENVLQAPLLVQVTAVDTGGDVVARAPWSSGDAASS